MAKKPTKSSFAFSPGHDGDDGGGRHGIQKFDKNYYSGQNSDINEDEMSHNDIREYKHHAVADLKGDHPNYGYRKIVARAKGLGLNVGSRIARRVLKGDVYTKED